MEGIVQDIRYGWRILKAHAGVSMIAVAALALGIGANTAIFSAVRAILLRPLPYAQPEQLVSLWETDATSGGKFSFSGANFADWSEQSTTCSQMTMFDLLSMNLTGLDRPERVTVVAASPNLFDTLHAHARLGRTFLPGEDRPNAPRVVVLSDKLWRTRFGADPAIVGQTINLNSIAREVVGVMPPDFEFPLSNMTRGFGEFTGGAELWVPLPFDRSQVSRNNHNHAGVARLAAGVSIKQAQSEMDSISRGLSERFPDSNGSVGVMLVPLHEQVSGDVQSSLLVLFGAVGFVLLIACVNVANLLLARASARHKEIAVRMALGAERSRIIRQLITESLLLAIAGAVAGFLLALWGIELLVRQIPPGVYGVNRIGVDLQVFVFTFVLSMLTGLLFGLAPAMQTSKPDVSDWLKEGSRGLVSGSRNRRLRSLLIISEVAISLVLLVGAGLMIRSFEKLQSVDTGFEHDKIVTAQLSLPAAKYREQRQWVAFYRESVERLMQIPGVESAGMVSHLPLSGEDAAFSFEIEGQTRSSADQPPWAKIRAATPNYFRAMGIPLISGREFNDADAEGRPAVLIVNDEMARRYWPGESALGKRISFDSASKQSGQPNWIEIVGIVKGVRHANLQTEPTPQMYVSYQQLCVPSMSIVVRTTRESPAIAGAMQEAITGVDKDQPIYNVRTVSQLIGNSAARSRFTTLALTMFAAVALSLAVIGIYGVMSYAVSQRTREIGIRIALGAPTRGVLKLIVGQGIALAGAGVLLGLAAAFALTRVMGSLLFQVSATDPATFGIVALVLLGVAWAACFGPARRASRVDPIIALREE
jgi:putative ABC transport system permease protein